MTNYTKAICGIVIAVMLAAWTSSSVVVTTCASHALESEVERLDLHYTFDVGLDYADHRLNAIEQIALPNPSDAALDKLVLNVPPAHGVGTFYLQDIRVEDKPARFDLTGTVLTVTLPAPLLPGEAVTLTLDFSLYIERLDGDVESFAAANLGYTDDAMTVGYWYPMLAPYRQGRGWLTVPWYPIGDPFASESADYTATITATPGVQIVAGGNMTREENVWHFDLPRARTFAFIASPRYWQTDVSIGGVAFSLYTFVEHARLAPVTMQTIVRSALLYGSLYGPYPYASLRVAEVSGPWSMEFSGLVTLGTQEFADYEGTQRNRLVRITAHEVSHQWWYSVVGDDQAREPWLDEGMARFNELRYYEFYSPGDVGWWRSVVLPYSEPGRLLDASIYDFHYHNSYISSIYNRGAIFLDALRAEIGQAAFNAFMRDLYARGSFRLITLDDFFAVLARHTQADVRLVASRFFAATPFETWRSSPVQQSDTEPAFKYPNKKCAEPQ